MMQLVIDHLWQSTLFAAAAGLLTLAFRNNAAGVRYWLWFIASVKFLVPFAWLASIGENLGWVVVPPATAPAMIFVMDLAAAPVAPASSFSMIAAVWFAGSAGVLIVWTRRYLEISRLARHAQPAAIDAPLAVKFVQAELEPGLLGILRPVLLLPSQLFTSLTAAEFSAILAHEVSHFRRRDNLTAAIHMLVQALFWFHPLVWWIGAKLVAERERACDEAVLAAGNDAGTYAEAILKVCRFYVRSPLICASGVSGADLKQRVEQIMKNRKARSLGFAKRFVLGAAALGAVAGPVVFGWSRAPEAASANAPVQSPLMGLSPSDIQAARELPYAEFLAAVERGEVSQVLVIETRVTGAFKKGGIFSTMAPISLWNDHTALSVLKKYNVSIMVPPRTDVTHPNIGPAEVYPPESKAAKEEGAVVLTLVVDGTGDVVDAKIAQSTGFARLDDAALKVALDKWRFMPGTVDGAPAVMTMKIRATFKVDADSAKKPS